MNNTSDQIKEAIEEVEKLRGELKDCDSELKDEIKHRLECQKIIFDLRSENARLAAALLKIERMPSKENGPGEAAWDALNDNPKALRDLLAPTIELLERARHKNLGTKHSDAEFDAHLNEELSRLRSLVERKQ